MSGLKEVRNRIVSVNSTSQITSAMKMVSAAKLKRAQDAIVDFRPYANKMKEILANVSASVEDSSENAFSVVRDVKNILVVSISSNRGLCGGFNSYVNKMVNKVAAENSQANLTVLSIGKKSTDFVKKMNFKTINSDFDFNLNEIFPAIDFSVVSEIANKVMDEFVSGRYDKVVLVYNVFKNPATQVVVAEQFLPFVPEADNNSSNNQTNYIFEPSKEFIVKELIPKSLKIQLYKAILDSHASEHGARMTAMHKATDNAKELLKELRLTYNKARQASITKEILEIIGGAEALNA